jgi:hypothetical protein
MKAGKGRNHEKHEITRKIRLTEEASSGHGWAGVSRTVEAFFAGAAPVSPEAGARLHFFV